MKEIDIGETDKFCQLYLNNAQKAMNMMRQNQF